MKTTLSSSEIYKRFGYWCEVDQKKAKNIPNYEPTMRPGQHNKKLDKVFVIPRDYIPEVINQRNVLASDFVTVYHRTHKGKKSKEVNFNISAASTALSADLNKIDSKSLLKAGIK